LDDWRLVVFSDEVSIMVLVKRGQGNISQFLDER